MKIPAKVTHNDEEPNNLPQRLLIVDSKSMHAALMKDAFLTKSTFADVQAVSCASTAIPHLKNDCSNTVLLSGLPHYIVHDAIDKIHRTDSKARIVLLDRFPCPSGLFLALRLRGYWTLEDSHEDLIREVRYVANGAKSLSPSGERLLKHSGVSVHGP